MAFFLDRKLEHEGQCETALRTRDHGNAIFHAAKAAEFAFALASETDGIVALRYVEDGEGWVEIAERLLDHPPIEKGPARTSERDGRTAVPDTAETAKDPWLITEKPSVTFDQIAGMAEAKRSIMEMIVHPLQHTEKARKLGLKPGGGVLLYGPPGNGKTTLAKAIAHELDARFYYASGAQIRSKWHGESEQRLRQLIEAARKNAVAVLFFDDLDGLLPRRSGGSSVVDNRIVTEFLQNIGGFEESGNVLLLLGATNKPWEIDEAVFRTGRFDEKIYIPPPDKPARLGILRMSLDAVPIEAGLDIDAWASRLDNFTGSDIVGLVSGAKRAALRRSIEDGNDPVVTNPDLDAAMQRIPSSITPRLLADYARFRETRFG